MHSRRASAPMQRRGVSSSFMKMPESSRSSSRAMRLLAHRCRPRARASDAAAVRHNARDERTAPPRRRDDVLESDRRRRPPLPADQARLARRPAALAPFDRGAARRRRDAGRSDAAVVPLPGSGGYRLPLRRAAIARVLAGLAPDLIEAGDPYRVAWGARDAAQTLGVPARRLLPLEHRRDGAARRRTPLRRARGARGRALCTPCLRRLRPRPRAEPQHGGAPRRWGVERVACQPLGVDTTIFRPEARDRPWRERHGWPDGRALLVYAGRFAPEKHLDVLADAVRRLGAPYVLLAVGAGPAPPPRGERVVVLPFVASTRELATLLASADAFVHAGDQETFGLSVLEAMACGTPAVLRDAEGSASSPTATARSRCAAAAAPAFAAAIALALRRRPRRAIARRAPARRSERLAARLAGPRRPLPAPARRARAADAGDARAPPLPRPSQR